MIVINKIEGIDELTRKLKSLPKVVAKATVSGLNKIGSQGTTQAKRKITSWYNIKQKDLKGHVMLIRARSASKTRAERHFAIVRGTGKPIPLMKFAARPTEPPVQKGIPVGKRKPVTVKVLKNQPRKIVRHAFVAQLRTTAAPNMFMRKGKARHPVRTLYSLGIQKMFEKEGIPAIEEIARTKGRRILEHELDFYLKKESGLLPAKGK